MDRVDRDACLLPKSRNCCCVGYLNLITLLVSCRSAILALDTLLDLDGLTLVVDPEGGHWVRFVVTQVPATPEKPHGLDYSLTLHGRNGERLVGFDNAHPVGRQKRGDPQDHRHRIRTVKPYEYTDAAALLADFWAEVDAVLKERGGTRMSTLKVGIASYDEMKALTMAIARGERKLRHGAARLVSFDGVVCQSALGGKPNSWTSSPGKRRARWRS